MAVTLTRADPAGADREALVDLLSTNEFPFHVHRRRSRSEVERAIEAGAYRDDDHETYWIEDDEAGRVGVVILEDLSDDAPLFDLRLAEEFRGRGLGGEVVRALTDHVFRTMPAVTRFEGQTREDHLAMRTVLRRCGFVKEAHYREAWPVEGRRPLASVAYGILRRDWETGHTTPLAWDDMPD